MISLRLTIRCPEESLDSWRSWLWSFSCSLCRPALFLNGGPWAEREVRTCQNTISIKSLQMVNMKKPPTCILYLPRLKMDASHSIELEGVSKRLDWYCIYRWIEMYSVTIILRAIANKTWITLNLTLHSFREGNKIVIQSQIQHVDYCNLIILKEKLPSVISSNVFFPGNSVGWRGS